MPRLFTGLEVPYDVQLALSLKRGGLSGARWIDPENYHITLRFIGDVDNHTANEVSYELDRLSQFGCVPDPAVASGRVRRRQAAGALCRGREQRRRCSGCRRRRSGCCGGPGLSRRAASSCRMCRWPGCAAASALEVADFIHHAGHFIPLEFTVGRFVLFSSKNSVGGGPYLVEQSLSAGGLNANAAGVNATLTLMGRHETSKRIRRQIADKIADDLVDVMQSRPGLESLVTIACQLCRQFALEAAFLFRGIQDMTSMRRRALSGLLATALICSAAPAFAQSQSDRSWNLQGVDRLEGRGRIRHDLLHFRCARHDASPRKSTASRSIAIRHISSSSTAKRPRRSMRMALRRRGRTANRSSARSATRCRRWSAIRCSRLRTASPYRRDRRQILSDEVDPR